MYLRYIGWYKYVDYITEILKMLTNFKNILELLSMGG
jgi:hypothetical protein